MIVQYCALPPGDRNGLNITPSAVNRARNQTKYTQVTFKFDCGCYEWWEMITSKIDTYPHWSMVSATRPVILVRTECHLVCVGVWLCKRLGIGVYYIPGCQCQPWQLALDLCRILHLEPERIPLKCVTIPFVPNKHSNWEFLLRIWPNKSRPEVY